MESILLPVLVTIAQLLMAVLLADLIGGLFHWAEDSYGDVDTPIWGPVFVRPNIGHHDRPTDILEVPVLRGIRIMLSVAIVVVPLTWMLNLLTWQLALVLALASLNDQVHRWAHTPTFRVPPAVRTLRRLGILQTARHHFRHHKEPHTSHYCVMTPWLNPVLDGLGFWRGLEWLLAPVLGPARVREAAARP